MRQSLIVMRQSLIVKTLKSHAQHGFEWGLKYLKIFKILKIGKYLKLLYVLAKARISIEARSSLRGAVFG